MRNTAVDWLYKLAKQKQLDKDDLEKARVMEYEQICESIRDSKPSIVRPYYTKKMTALGELIRWSEYNYLGTDKQAMKVIDKAKELLDKERQDIIDAVDNSIIKRRCQGKLLNSRISGEKYFTKTFKNK